MITASALAAILPRAPKNLLDAYANALHAAMVAGQITTVTRAAAFIGQFCGLETGELRWLEEIADGTAYEGRRDLGNVKPGDGRRYKGRGLPMLTGRNNYRAFGLAMGVDFEATPELVSLPEWAFKAGAWFWTDGAWKRLSPAALQRLGAGPLNLNAVADRCDMMGLTLAINGGLTNHSERVAYYHRALEVIGLNAPVIA